MEPYKDNIEEHNLQEDIGQAVTFLKQHASYVMPGHWEVLAGIGERFRPVEEEEGAGPMVYDANFSMADELQAQIRAVRAIRNKIMSDKGVLSDDISTREAKEVVSSGSTLLGTLMKYHEKVVNMERMRMLESSVIEALAEVDEEVRDRVLFIMEEKLANLA